MTNRCPACNQPIVRKATCEECGAVFTPAQRGPVPSRCVPCRQGKTVLPSTRFQHLLCLACGNSYHRLKKGGRPPLRCPDCPPSKPLLPQYAALLPYNPKYPDYAVLFRLVRNPDAGKLL